MRRGYLAALALSVGPLAGTASADVITFRGVGHASVVSIAGVRTGTFWAGELNWRWATPDPAGQPHDIYSYCVDVAHNLASSQTVSLESSDDLFDSTPDGGKKAAWLFNKYAAGIRGNANDAQADISAAALQVAIWESMLDSSYNLGQGRFRLTSNGAVRTQALLYLADLYSKPGGGYHTSEALWLDVANPNTGQDQITRMPPIPEPGTMLLLGTGVAALCARRRRLA